MISFVDPLNGWLLEEDCSIVGCVAHVDATSDGGEVWRRIASLLVRSPLPRPPNTILPAVQSIFLATPSDGWLFDPGLYITRDGGVTWTDAGVTDTVTDISMAGGVVWMVRGPCDRYAVCNRTLLASADMGRTSTPVPAQPPQAAFDGLTVRAGSQNGWLFGAVVAATHDGGANWQTLPNAPNTSRRTVSAADGQLWIVLDDNPATMGMSVSRVVHTSVDGGLTWATIDLHRVPCMAESLAAASRLRAFIGTNFCGVMRTDDGGQTWRALPGSTVGGDPLVTQILFVDSQHGWAVGGTASPRVVLHTVDGGDHWRRFSVP